MSLMDVIVMILTLAGCTSGKQPVNSNLENSSKEDTVSDNSTSSGNSSVKDTESYYDYDPSGNDGWSDNLTNSNNSNIIDDIPEVKELKSVTLTLYKEEGNTYTYGITWQSDVQLTKPFVEILPANETDWAKARKIIGTSDNSVLHKTFKIKDGWDYDTISSAFAAAGGKGAWYYSGITMSHNIINIYSNKLIIKGLTAGQSYKYRVGDAHCKRYSSKGTFTAYNKAGNDFKFIYMADSQQSFASSNVNAWRNTLNAALASIKDAAFIAIGGDLINWNAIEAQWEGLLDYNKNYIMNIPLMPAAGNHEINMTASGTGIEFGDFNSHFNLPYSSEYDNKINSVGGFKANAKPQQFANGATGTYYSYDYKKVHFVVLNTNDIYISHRDRTDGKYVLGDAQMAWLKDDLADAKAREKSGELDFTIVCMHAGLYTTGAAGLGKDYKETCDLYEQLQSVFADNNVDLVMSGHDHVYSRTKVLDKNGVVSTVGGVIYMSGGVAGVNSPGVAYFAKSDTINEGASKFNTADKYAYYAKTAYTNCWTEISVTSSGIMVNTYRKDSSTAIDTFMITKNNKTVIS